MSNTKYVDPLLDLSFKRIFSVDRNRDLLIAFLNEVFKGRKRIVDLTYNKNEHHGNNKEEGSAIFYTSRLISEQAPKGEMDDMPPQLQNNAVFEKLYNISEYSKPTKRSSARPLKTTILRVI